MCIKVEKAFESLCEEGTMFWYGEQMMCGKLFPPASYQDMVHNIDPDYREEHQGWIMPVPSKQDENDSLMRFVEGLIFIFLSAKNGI